MVYLVKVLKFKAGIQTIDAKSFIKHFRNFSKRRAQNLAISNPKVALDKTKNRTYSSQMVYALQILKVIESFVLLLSFSYFVGIGWFIACDLFDNELDDLSDNKLDSSFLRVYNLDVKHGTLLVVYSMTYFMSTTLMTIGLGDFHPHTNIERITCVFLMVIGVAIFSVINQQINFAMDRVQFINRPQRDAEEQLERFFCVLFRFNGNNRIDESL